MLPFLLGRHCAAFLTGQTLCCLSYWAGIVLPFLLGRHCAAFLTGQTLCCLSYWADIVLPFLLGRHCAAFLTGQTLCCLSYWANIVLPFLLGRHCAAFLLVHLRRPGVLLLKQLVAYLTLAEARMIGFILWPVTDLIFIRARSQQLLLENKQQHPMSFLRRHRHFQQHRLILHSCSSCCLLCSALMAG